MNVETAIILLLVIVILLVIWSVRKNRKSAALPQDVVTLPTSIVLPPSIPNFKSKPQDNLTEPAIPNEPVSLLNFEEEDPYIESLEPDLIIESPKLTAEQLVAEYGRYDQQLDLSSYRKPPLNILNTEIDRKSVV